MAKLALAPPLNDHEPPTSYASRLAIAHGLSAVELCGDFGIRYTDLINGVPAALAKLAELGDLDVSLLTRFAFILVKGFEYVHCGAIIVRDSLRRRRIEACPHCLLEDLRCAGRDPETKPFNRAEWCLDVVDTCTRHGVALALIDKGSDYRLRHDFANLVAPKMDRLARLAEQARPRKATQLQNYALGRLYGPRMDLPFLDQMDLHVAIRTCEMLGTAACFGRKADFEELDAGGRRKARIRGFEIASRGKEGIHELLHEMWWTFLRRRKAEHGGFGRQAFGRIHYFLRTDPNDPKPKDMAFTELRGVVGDFMRENFPLGPGDFVFGEPVLERTVHSVRTLHRETGLNPRRLVKLLFAAGVVSKRQISLADHNITFNADKGRQAVLADKDQVPYTLAAKHLGVGRHQLISLIKAGLIETLGANNPLEMRTFVSKTRVEAFTARLTADVRPVTRKETGQATIVEAALHANCSQIAVVKLILERKLNWVGKLERRRGYNSILVDLAEVRLIVHGIDPEALSMLEFADRYEMKKDTARALVKHGHLRGVPVDRVGGQRGQVLIEVAEADAFQKRYISLGELGRQMGSGYRVIKRELASRGVLPVFDPKKVVGHFFDREAVRSATRED
jgi:TniQ